MKSERVVNQIELVLFRASFRHTLASTMDGDLCEMYHPLINASYDDRLDIVQRELTAHPDWLDITCEVCMLLCC